MLSKVNSHLIHTPAVVGADTIEDLPKCHRGNKRKPQKEFEFVCGKEVTDSQRESSAAKCSRAGV
jgi:hypothetical protein